MNSELSFSMIPAADLLLCEMSKPAHTIFRFFVTLAFGAESVFCKTLEDDNYFRI